MISLSKGRGDLLITLHTVLRSVVQASLWKTITIDVVGSIFGYFLSLQLQQKSAIETAKEKRKCWVISRSPQFPHRLHCVATHPSSLTSARDRFKEIMSLARRLNWLSLNFSFMRASLSGGMCTALPISPGTPCAGMTVGAGRHLRSSLCLYVDCTPLL
jgi:hypothetical protein